MPSTSAFVASLITATPHLAPNFHCQADTRFRLARL
jgi:hypothetical protein